MKNLIKPICISACALLMAGCAVNPVTGKNEFKMPDGIKNTFDNDDPCSNNARNTGVAIGTLAGLVIGNQLNHSNESRLLAAGIGAGIGGLIGHDIDTRRCALSKIAKQDHLDMQISDIKRSQTSAIDAKSGDGNVGMVVALNDGGHQFNSNMDTLTPEALIAFTHLAKQYAEEQREDTKGLIRDRRIMLVGHTDDTGSSQNNADLSERRARAVAKVFESQGIKSLHLYYQGAGETLPMADNHTEEGRAKNRRVEIVDVQNDADFRGYITNRRPNLAFYRNVAPATPSANENVLAKNTARHASHHNKRHAASNVASAPADHASGPAAHASASAIRHIATSAKGRASTANESNEIDFGGSPISKSDNINLGEIKGQSSFSLISSAHADEFMTGMCVNDRPRVSHGVKSLASGKDINGTEFMPGLYGSSWSGMINKNLVSLTNVSVLRDGGLPSNLPLLQIYQNYTGDVSAKGVKLTPSDVNVYQGQKALLYRVFMASGPVSCMDVVFPYSARDTASDSKLYYKHEQAMYQAQMSMKFAGR